MKTTLFLLSLLLLSLPAKAQDNGAAPDKTFWHDQLTDVKVGSNSTSGSDDVLLSVTDNDTTYTVKTAKGLAWIAKVTNEGLLYKNEETNTANYPHRAGFEGCTVELDGSLTDSLSLRAHYWTPIGDASKPFKGAFDGNHKLVAGLKADTVITQRTSVYVGLFGCIEKTSVSNVGVWVAVEGIRGSSIHNCYVGGIAGYSANSTIRYCFVSGDAGATIKGEGYCFAGGIVGENRGIVENCYTTVDVSTSGNGISCAGGIAGSNERSIISVYATGKVTGTGTDNLYFFIGGITGSNNGTISKALALNKDGLSRNVSGTGGNLCLGRISGDKGSYYFSFSQCYASTKIDTTTYKDTRQDTYFDGTDASVATDLSLLFPTGEDGNSVWTSGGTDKLPQLSSFPAADASTGKHGQPVLAKADYLEELPLGTEGNPYVIDISSVSSDNIGKNQFTYSYTGNNVTLTLLKPDSCYLIKDKAKGGSNTYTVSLNTEGADGKPYHLYAQAGCAIDTLLVPAGTACIIQGDSLRSKSCQVRGGTLTMEVPVVLEMPEASGSYGWQESSLYIDGGSVTVNDTLKAYAKGISAYGIRTQSSSTLTIGSKGVVYAYGEYWGCSLFSDKPVVIENGGILRVAAGTLALVAEEGSLSFPAIEWEFDYAPDSARLTLKKDGGNEVAATFSEKVFGPYFDEATLFATNVEGNTTYHLYAGENTTPFNGRMTINGNDVAAFTNEFTASENNGLQSYGYVGLPMETFSTAPDSITLTNRYTYRVGKADKDTHFDNVLSCEVKKLRITSGSTNYVLLNGVTITDSLLVEKQTTFFYLLDNTVNTLGNVRVEHGGALTLDIGGNGTLASTTFVNSHNFTDNIGLVEEVKASIAPGDTLLISRPSVSGTMEITPGGTTTLTVTGASDWQQGANSSVSPTYSYYWQEWKGEGWEKMNGNTTSSLTVGKGKYRCRVTYELKDAGNSSIFANTALCSLPVEVKEKSAPPYIPPVVSYYTVTLPEVEGARLDKTGSHTVEEGYSFPFRLTLDADYDRSQPVVSIDRHGTETLTPEVLADGSLKYRIRDVEQDLTVSITGIVRNDDPTAAGSVPATDVRVRSFGDLLHITVPAPTSARLYDFHGRLLRTALLPAGSSTMPKPAGPCIVVIGGESFKVGD